MTCSRTCLSLASTLTARSFTLRHSPTTPRLTFLQKHACQRDDPEACPSSWIFTALRNSAELCSRVSRLCFLDVGEIKTDAYLKWQRRAVPLEARSECFLLSWIEDLFKLWQSQGWWNGWVSISWFLASVRWKRSPRGKSDICFFSYYTERNERIPSFSSPSEFSRSQPRCFPQRIGVAVVTAQNLNGTSSSVRVSVCLALGEHVSSCCVGMSAV